MKAKVKYYFASLSGRYANFCRIIPKVVISHPIISGVTAPNFIKYVRNVAKILPFNILKSELQVSNPFRNGSVPNKGALAMATT